jgi:hypothetical protein
LALIIFLKNQKITFNKRRPNFFSAAACSGYFSLEKSWQMVTLGGGQINAANFPTGPYLREVDRCFGIFMLINP